MDTEKEWITIKEHEAVVDMFASHFDQFKKEIWKLCGQNPLEGVELRDEQVLSVLRGVVHEFELDIEVEEVLGLG